MTNINWTERPPILVELDKNGNLVKVTVNKTVVNGQMTKENSNNNLKLKKNGEK